jgi:hypothetical protein
MKDYIRRSGYLIWAARQMETWPKNYKPAFNALAVASAHKRRRYYPARHKALVRSGVNFMQYSECLDEDFADFRVWLAEQEQTSNVENDDPTPSTPSLLDPA